MYVHVCMCISVRLGECVFQFAAPRPVRAIRTGNRRFGPDLDSCSLWTRYTGDSKTNARDDPKIHTGSCSEDHTMIQFRNHVISCECLFLSIFLFTIVSRHLYITCIISCDRLIYFTSLISCITSWGISDCLPYLCS